MIDIAAILANISTTMTIVKGALAADRSYAEATMKSQLSDVMNTLLKARDPRPPDYKSGALPTVLTRLH